MDTINNNSSNILDQLASYNSDDLENYFGNLKSVISEQEQLNSVLKSNTHNDNITYVKNFIQRNTGQIDYQLEEIQKLTNNIYKICLENKELQDEKAEYKDLIDSEECKSIAKKLNEIKKTKENMRAFLLKKGIHLSPN